MVRQTLGWAVFAIGLAIVALVVFSWEGRPDEKLWLFGVFATIPAAAALIATVWVQPKEVSGVSEKIIRTLWVLLAFAGVLLVLLFLGFLSFAGRIDGGM